ncbi:hypothetical protein EDD18DRAFT_1335097 [Armillaria luteobubalina]|uniref:F-box domain-containing protein n=1 Tax=Armillaria luteobubalina TaxID=153913 RepID=A0AA39PPU4_9AGAR|nr:hypothetical protein EDD18DRAFT_1335097 [Armillaria luteobubalina]
MFSRSSRKRRFRFEEFPVELILEILSHLGVTSLKELSLTSSKLRFICFPVIFEDMSFHDRKTPRNFLTTMCRRRAIPCIRKLSLNNVDSKDISPALLQWCALAQKIKIATSNPTVYVPLLSGLGELRLLQLDRVTFQHFTDLFKVLQSLSTSVTELRFGDVGFASQSYGNPIPYGRKRIRVEGLCVGTSLVLELLLREESPVDFSNLKVAETRNVGSHSINKLGRRSPHLIKLIITDPPLDSNNESLELTAVKQLNLSFYRLQPGFKPLRDLFKPSKTNLEELTIKLPVEFVTRETREQWESLAIALSRRPRLRAVHIVLWAKWDRGRDAQLILRELHHAVEPRRCRILEILANNRFQVAVEGTHWVGY